MGENTFLKIGKYGRPIFWSYLMITSFDFVVTFIKRELLEGRFELRNLFIDLFMIGVLLITFALSVYKVTHPHISKEGYDDENEQWAVGLCALGIFIILQLLLQHFFGFDLMEYLSSSGDISL